MTVSNTTNTAQYLGNGATTAFAFTPSFFSPLDLVVTLFDTAANTAVVPAPVLNGGGTYDYTVTGNLDANTGEYLAGGTITFNTAALGNHRVTIQRVIGATQGVSLINNGPFPAKTLEAALDRLTMLQQQSAQLLAQSILIPASDPAGLITTLPPALVRALQGIVFDGAGNITAGAPAAAAVSVALQPVVAAATLPLARGALDVPFGNCRLLYGSALQIKLVPYGGDLIKVAGQVYQIPAAGILGANTNVFVNGVAGQNLAAGTGYYVFLFVNAGVLTLDYRTFSDSGHTADTTAGNVGVEVRQTAGLAIDNSRTLIGAILTDGTGKFQDTSAIQGVANWFNRRLRYVDSGAFSSSTASTSAVVLANSQVTIFGWNDELTAYAGYFGNVLLGSLTTSAFTDTYVGVGGSAQATLNIKLPAASTPIDASMWQPIGPGLTENFTVISTMGDVGNAANTGTWTGHTFASSRV